MGSCKAAASTHCDSAHKIFNLTFVNPDKVWKQGRGRRVVPAAFKWLFNIIQFMLKSVLKCRPCQRKKDCIVVNLPRRKGDLFWIFKMQQSPFLPPLKLHSKLQILPVLRRNWSRCDIGFVCCLHPFTSDFEVIFVCFLGAEDFS